MQVSLIKFMSFSTAEQYPKLVNGPPSFIFERRRVGRNKSATNMSAREVGSRHEKRNKE